MYQGTERWDKAPASLPFQYEGYRPNERPPMRMDIGTWGDHTDSVGVAFLQGKQGSLQEEIEVFASFAREVLEKHPNGIAEDHVSFKSFSDRCLLPAAARTALMEYSDAKRITGEEDSKLELSPDELVQLIGRNKLDELEALFHDEMGGEISEIKIRRVEPQGGRCINFHTDCALRTMQVPLNGASEYQGGKLVYATPNGLVWPCREAGSATIHDNSVPHGVSAHTSGVRYGLFFLEKKQIIDTTYR